MFKNYELRLRAATNPTKPVLSSKSVVGSGTAVRPVPGSSVSGITTVHVPGLLTMSPLERPRRGGTAGTNA